MSDTVIELAPIVIPDATMDRMTDQLAATLGDLTGAAVTRKVRAAMCERHGHVIDDEMDAVRHEAGQEGRWCRRCQTLHD